jgi:pseudo-response regulator 7
MDGSYGTRVLPSGGLAVNSSCPSQMGMPPDGTGSSKGSGEVCTPLETDAQNPHNGNGQDTSSSVVPQAVVQNGSKPTNKETAVLHGMPRPTSNPSPGHLHYEGVPAGYGPTMHPMYYVHPGPAWVAAPSPHLSDQGEVFDHPSIYQHHVAFGHMLHPHNNQQPYYHSHHRHNTHYHEHHNHPLNFQPPPLPQQQGEQPTAGSPHCCSAATVLDRTNGQSGSSSILVNENPSRTKDPGNVQNCHCNGAVAGATGETTGNSGSGSGVDNSANVKNGFDNFDGIMPSCTPEDRFAWREAALNKFRQKRKERCFAKKVNYSLTRSWCDVVLMLSI